MLSYRRGVPNPKAVHDFVFVSFTGKLRRVIHYLGFQTSAGPRSRLEPRLLPGEEEEEEEEGRPVYLLHKSTPVVINWTCLRINAASVRVCLLYACVCKTHALVMRTRYGRARDNYRLLRLFWGAEQNRSRCQHTHLQSTDPPEA